MLTLLTFLGALAAMAVGAIVVNRIRGVRAHYLDAWTPAPGERRVLEDPAADFYVIPRLGQAKIMTFARRGRTHAVLTDRRIVIGTRVLLKKRWMITHMVHLAGAGTGPEELAHLTGGQFSTGFSAYSARADRMTIEDDHGKAYLHIVPEPTASSANIEHLRLYSDRAAEFARHAAGG